MVQGETGFQRSYAFVWFSPEREKHGDRGTPGDESFSLRGGIRNENERRGGRYKKEKGQTMH